MIAIHATAEERIVDILQSNGPCSLEDVVRFLHPRYSWSNVFIAVDQMSRNGRLLLRRLGNSTYQIALPSPLVFPRSPSRQEEAQP